MPLVKLTLLLLLLLLLLPGVRCAAAAAGAGAGAAAAAAAAVGEAGAPAFGWRGDLVELDGRVREWVAVVHFACVDAWGCGVWREGGLRRAGVPFHVVSDDGGASEGEEARCVGFGEWRVYYNPTTTNDSIIIAYVSVKEMRKSRRKRTRRKCCVRSRRLGGRRAEKRVFVSDSVSEAWASLSSLSFLSNARFLFIRNAFFLLAFSFSFFACLNVLKFFFNQPRSCVFFRSLQVSYTMCPPVATSQRPAKIPSLSPKQGLKPPQPPPLPTHTPHTPILIHACRPLSSVRYCHTLIL